MAALVSEAQGHSLSCRCNIILEGLNRANLASRIDSLKAVQAVYRHVMDRVQGKVLVKRPISAVIHESAANHVTCRVFFRLCCLSFCQNQCLKSQAPHGAARLCGF